MNVVLISTYELGRQPFSLASPAAWLQRSGFEVSCLDLSVERLSDHRESVRAADLLAVSLPMHTATRLAAPLAPKLREINPTAHLCFYGLYAPVNERYLRTLGASVILGGEFEEGLRLLAKRLAAGRANADSAAPSLPGRGPLPWPQSTQPEPLISVSRQTFLRPDRAGLPTLARYAQLQLPSGGLKIVGYTETSRGCKHLCRHCPVVPVYRGIFRVVQQDAVLEDIRQQVAAGAQHITFGDPDFFNGPLHAAAVVEALHAEFPNLTYDATIKVEHLLKYRKYLPLLRDTGCTFVTSAVESVDDRVLAIYRKNHTRQDFIECVRLLREAGLVMNPTFVTFSPWISVEGYCDLLHVVKRLDLVEHVAPVQYAIRLLVPPSSALLELDEVRKFLGPLDSEGLCYTWKHPDAKVDGLYRAVLAAVKAGQVAGDDRRKIFASVWKLAHEVAGNCAHDRLRVAENDQALPRATVPFLTEPWYC